MKKLKADLPYNVTQVFHSFTYPKDLIFYYKDMFIATIFTITRKWKQTECPSTDEWVMKMPYIVGLYSAVKEN